MILFISFLFYNMINVRFGGFVRQMKDVLVIKQTPFDLHQLHLRPFTWPASIAMGRREEPVDVDVILA